MYEYRCNDCRSVFEVLRPMAERELAAVCPCCESRASMPLISRVTALAGAGAGAGAAPEAASQPSSRGGGCCGGSCGCGG
jgi:putative FmdB family regulatory protein